MKTRRTRHPAALPTKMLELSLAVPAVVSHRLTRIALAGPTPSPRDRREFQLMSSEKSAAYAQSWQAMSLEMFRVQQAFGWALMRAFFLPALWGVPSNGQLGRQLERATTRVMNKGLAPVHRTAVANAKRLSRTALK